MGIPAGCELRSAELFHLRQFDMRQRFGAKLVRFLTRGYSVAPVSACTLVGLRAVRQDQSATKPRDSIQGSVFTLRCGLASPCLWMLAWVVLTLVGCPQDEGDFTELMNRGKAHLENRDALKAVEALRRAVNVQPNSTPALRNLARAYRMTKQPDLALGQLDVAIEHNPESVATIYLKALTLTSLSRPKEALPLFERAVRLDAKTATLRFQLAGAYEVAGDSEKSASQLRETVRLDHLHGAAHYKLAGVARRAKDTKAFEKHMREFLRLRELFGDETRSRDALEQCRYTSPEAPPIASATVRSGRAPSIIVRFVDVTDSVFAAEPGGHVMTAAVLDVDDTGRATLFAVYAGGACGLLKMSRDGTFRRTPLDLKLAKDMPFLRCHVGDFHDDVPPDAKYDFNVHAKQDVLLSGPAGLRLLKRLDSGSFRDVTADAGLGNLTANAAVWVDYEHDGDLDLLLARDTGVELWQNNGNAKFENVTDTVGIAPAGSAVDVLVVDLHKDVAVDLIVAHDKSPTLVYENRRAGRFERMIEPPGPWPVASRVLANDVNNDGHIDTVLIGNDQATIMLGQGGKQTIKLDDIDVAAAKLVDYDNDGWLDLCVVGTVRGTPSKGSIHLFRNTAAGWINVDRSTGLAKLSFPPITDVLALDIDGDGDTDLLPITARHGLHMLRNDGGHANGQLKVRLKTIKTNPTGLGTHIELRDRDFWLTRVVNARVIELGLGGRRHFDSLQTVWTNGVVDNQIGVDIQPIPLTIQEKVVPTGSCPFLYAWNGKGFRFVTDLLGNSPIGLPARRDVMLPADPDEIVTIGPAATFPPYDGAYTVVVTNEFREILYLDQVKLMAVDHSPEAEAHPTDKIMPPPFPASEVVVLHARHSLLSAEGSDGIDRTTAVREMDGVFAPPGLPLPPPYRGTCHPIAITLDFKALNVSRPLVLALTGWLQYGDASTNIAIGQNRDLTIIPPTLEAQTTDGAWRPVDVIVGMPAGKTKTILCDLTGKLPDGARRLRLTTTFEIRWYRIALFERAAASRVNKGEGPRVGVHEASPLSAELRWRGFSDIKSRAAGHPRTPRFDIVSQRPPWRTALEGWHTRYGDVLDLVARRDERLAIVGAGDALTLRFDASLFPPVPEGLVRTFFFYSVGWDKDGDHNVSTGQTVAPLPIGVHINASDNGEFPPTAATPPGEHDWRIRFNTRWVPRDPYKPGPVRGPS